MSNVGFDLGEYKLTFYDDDEPKLVELSPYVLLRCERRWPGREVDHSDWMPRWEGLLFAMWIAYSGGTGGKEEAFYKRVRTIEFVGVASVDPSPMDLSGD